MLIIMVRMRKNYGKSTALHHGMKKIGTVGYVLHMDGDLEDQPEMIPRLLKKIEKEGYDCVVGWRYGRKHSFQKKIFSKFFNKLSNMLSGLDIHDANSGFKLMTVEAAKSLDLHGELHRYIPHLLHNNGFKVGEEKVEHANRIHGKSKYGMFRIVIGFIDLLSVTFLTKYGDKPSQFFSLAGLGSIGLSILTEGITLYRRLVLHHPIEIMGTTTALLFTTGILCIFFGLIAELMIIRKGDKDYKVKEVKE
jgi:glycosyltransferase involved in cell wall biosynthesis